MVSGRSSRNCDHLSGVGIDKIDAAAVRRDKIGHCMADERLQHLRNPAGKFGPRVGLDALQTARS